MRKVLRNFFIFMFYIISTPGHRHEVVLKDLFPRILSSLSRDVAIASEMNNLCGQEFLWTPKEKDCIVIMTKNIGLSFSQNFNFISGTDSSQFSRLACC